MCVVCCIAEEGGEHGATILQKSHRGFFTGILVLSGGFVAIIMFYFSSTEFTKALIYVVTLISLHSIMLLATGAALLKINKVPCTSPHLHFTVRWSLYAKLMVPLSSSWQ